MNVSGGGGGVTLKSRVTQIIKLKLAVLGALNNNKGSGGAGEGGDGEIEGEENKSNLTRQWKSVRKSIGDISITSSVQVSY